jgi:hypothetical protein
MCWEHGGEGLREGLREMFREGLREVPSWTGSAERAVLLPHVTDVWTDHIDSTLRRADAVVNARA